MRASLGLALMIAMSLSACDKDANRTAGGVTEPEAAALDNAAEMLDASPDGLTAPEDMPLESESNAADGHMDGNSQ